MIKKFKTVITKGFYLDILRFPIQLIEFLKDNDLANVMHDIVYFNRELVVAERDLSSIRIADGSSNKLDANTVEINKDNFETLSVEYPFKSRYIKALKNVQNGYKSFAIVKGNKIIGDIWYATSMNSSHAPKHPDLDWLGIHLGEKDVYLWDVFVNREERNSLAALSLFKFTLQRLKQEGYSKVYGFIFADNKPSITLIKLLKFRELKKLNAHRIFFYKTIKKNN